jgi:uncharacterized membrane protein (DUF485 family)
MVAHISELETHMANFLSVAIWRRALRWLLTGTTVGTVAVIAWKAGWLSTSDPIQAAPVMILGWVLFFLLPAIYVYRNARKYPQLDAGMEFFVVFRMGMWGLRHYLDRRDNNFEEPL